MSDLDSYISAKAHYDKLDKDLARFMDAAGAIGRALNHSARLVRFVDNENQIRGRQDGLNVFLKSDWLSANEWNEKIKEVNAAKEAALSIYNRLTPDQKLVVKGP